VERRRRYGRRGRLAWDESLTPGNEQRDYWGSHAANTPGSRNLVGIADKAVDELIDRVVFAVDREELVAATRALDRVLLWHHYVVPQWTDGEVRTAHNVRLAKAVPLVSTTLRRCVTMSRR
jgi:microcin C transport system substrate-binding protein